MDEPLKSLSPAEHKAVKSFTGSVREAFPNILSGMVLFGSRARGEGNGNSDIDILVLVEEESHAVRTQIFDMAGDIYLASDINISPLVIGRERFEWLRKIERGIALDIEREGVEL